MPPFPSVPFVITRITLLATLALGACAKEPPATPAAVVPAPAETPPAVSASPPSPAATPHTPTATGPRLALTTTRHDFGQIWDVHPQACEFPFTNTGSTPLQILRVDPGCSCTSANVPVRRLAPGESSAVQITYNPTGHRGPKDLRVRLVTNDPTQNVAEMRFAAMVSPFLRFQPDLLRFDVVAKGQPHEATIAVTSPDPEMVIESLKTTARTVTTWGLRDDGDFLAARLLGPDEPIPGPASFTHRPGQQLVAVTIKDTAPWGALFGQIDVTARGKLPSGETVTHTTTVHCNASVYGDLRVQQQMFSLGQVNPGTTFRVTNRLTRRSGQPFSIVSTNVGGTPIPGIRVLVEPIRAIDEVGYDLTVTGNVGNHAGAITGAVTIRTDVAGEEELHVRLTGFARK
ncbi:MAG: DUF1573 domain-containing protein [Phycisphaerales bacterium]|nr:DUF1573 domain-containing protein [Phycisphaerae bacterium]NNF44122.1 DUF1573 domain-containing protein [Phycisphaerales bacterium]NNM24780.1 DUF1573 domain-containing protein [Phycisphaerales bacterium]